MMNLAESVKLVLKTKSQSIFNDFWKNDLKFLIKDMIETFSKQPKPNLSGFEALKKMGFKESIGEAKSSAFEAMSIVKIVPKRVTKAFKVFKEDLLQELESLPDQKQKTIFCLKVVGALSKFALGIFYGMKETKVRGKLLGISKYRNKFTQFLMAHLVFKMSQIFILKFLDEVTKEMTDPEEIKHLKYFRKLLSDTAKVKEDELEHVAEPGDRAFELVENLKNYILTGKPAPHYS